MTASGEDAQRRPRFRQKRGTPLWCDKLGSTPGFGFTFEPHFASSSSLLDAVTDITNGMMEDGQKVRFTIDRQDQFAVSFTSFSGFNYTLDPFKSAVLFQYRGRIKRISGAPAMMHMLSEPKPYGDLLDEVVDRSISAARLLPNVGTRKLTRIGLMSTTAVVEEDLPPGIISLLNYQKRSWGGEVPFYNLQFTVSLGKGETTADRCICTLNKSEDDEDKLVTVVLDWQRTFTPGKASTSRSLEALAAECKLRALAYFESLGDGEGYDEVVYSSVS